MFCSECGENLVEGAMFCPECGNKVASNVSGTINSAIQPVQSINSNTFRYIIMGCALLLCILFFTLPLVQCSQDSSYTASGWEIATGTGKIFSEKDKGYPLAFLLIIIPVALLIFVLTKKSFAVLNFVSITGLAAEIIFFIYANLLLNSGEYKGAFELTGFNWLVLFIYIGLCVFTFCGFLKKPNISDPQKDGQAIASLIFGVIGLLFTPVSIVGIIMGVIGLNSTKRKMAIAGLIISIIGLIALIIGVIYIYEYYFKGVLNLRNSNIN